MKSERNLDRQVQIRTRFEALQDARTIKVPLADRDKVIAVGLRFDIF